MIEKILEQLKSEKVYSAPISKVPTCDLMHITDSEADSRIANAAAWLESFERNKNETHLNQAIITIMSIAKIDSDLTEDDRQSIIKDAMIHLFSNVENLETTYRWYGYEIRYGTPVDRSFSVGIHSYEIKHLKNGYTIKLFVYKKSDYNLLASMVNILNVNEQFNLSCSKGLMCDFIIGSEK